MNTHKHNSINCNIKYFSPEEMFPFIKESNSKSLITIPDYREIILMLRTEQAFNGCGKMLQSEIDVTKKLSAR